jgi:integrase
VNQMLITTAWLGDPAYPALMGDVVDKAREYVQQSRSTNTVRAYRSDWQQFQSWCDARHLVALPAAAETVALYLADLADQVKPSTIQRRIASISQAHQAAGHESPTKSAEVKSVWRGIRRAKGTAQKGKDAATTAEIRAMVDHLPESLMGTRDRAALLLGFAGAFRRSELVSLDVADLGFTREGLVVTLRRSKTDQEGEGVKKGIPYGSNLFTCPVRSLQAWLEAAGISEGPLFRGIDRHGRLLPGRFSDKGVARVVKRAAEAAGLDPTRYSGHSLRAGLATAAAAADVPERVIMAQTGHRSTAMVRRYIRNGSLFRENAAAAVGL